MRPIPCLSFNIKKLPFKRSEKGNFFIFKLNERHEGENDEANFQIVSNWGIRVFPNCTGQNCL
jgi:hypothetical protein